MRFVVAVVLALALVPIVLASPEALYVDETRTLLVGASGVRSPDVAGIDVTTASMFVPVDACHVELRASFAWAPASVGASAAGRSVEALTAIRVRLENASGPEPGASWDLAGGFGSFVKRVPPSSEHELVVTLLVGANVTLHTKVYGWVDRTAPSC